jgi:hypothetical protein
MLHLLTELELLRTELESDVASAQTRDQHLRLSFRIQRLNHIIDEMKSVQPTS